MYRWIVAIVVAAICVMTTMATGSAQSCADFGSQKEAQMQLEQVGDPGGTLDTDLNGYACDEESSDEAVLSAEQEAEAPVEDDAAEAPAEDDAEMSGDMTLDVSGTEDSDDDAGASNTTVSTVPGDEAAMEDDGAGNEAEEGVVAVDNAAPDDNFAAAGDAVATNDETGETAIAGDAVAIDVDEVAEPEPKPDPAPEPKPEPAPEPAPAPAPEVAPAPAAPAAPVQLPNTGVGAAEQVSLGSILLLVGSFAAAGAALLSRRFGRA